MSDDKYKALYQAQCAEHEKTHERLREAQKTVANIRAELVSTQAYLRVYEQHMRDIAQKINAELEGK